MTTTSTPCNFYTFPSFLRGENELPLRWFFAGSGTCDRAHTRKIVRETVLPSDHPERRILIYICTTYRRDTRYRRGIRYYNTGNSIFSVILYFRFICIPTVKGLVTLIFKGRRISNLNRNGKNVLI